MALDLDGTLTDHDELSLPALAAVDDLREDGLAALLSTGRILNELEHAYPGLVGRFDAVVAENGAVLAVEDDVRELAAPVEESLAGALADRGVPCRRGRVLLAGDAADAPTVVGAAGLLGLDCQIVRNRN
ncbi:MAG TPA: HAD hydrolase family protein, partial [Solirubrobacteraceae bacterium]|nr:HAD hydrolase family protein [Solirubrobacteraceae bacterium]